MQHKSLWLIIASISLGKQSTISMLFLQNFIIVFSIYITLIIFQFSNWLMNTDVHIICSSLYISDICCVDSFLFRLSLTIAVLREHLSVCSVVRIISNNALWYVILGCTQSETEEFCQIS